MGIITAGGGPHATSHQDGGVDEVNVTGLTGAGGGGGGGGDADIVMYAEANTTAASSGSANTPTPVEFDTFYDKDQADMSFVIPDGLGLTYDVVNDWFECTEEGTYALHLGVELIAAPGSVGFVRIQTPNYGYSPTFHIASSGNPSEAMLDIVVHMNVTEHFRVIQQSAGTSVTQLDNYAALDIIRLADGGGGGGPTELVTGDDKDYEGSIGAWVGDPTFSLDSGNPWLDSQTNALKAIFSDDGDVATLPIGGTFQSGHTYHSAVVITSPVAAQSDCGFFVYFGDEGAVDHNDQGYAFVHGFQDEIVVFLTWTPTANRTAAAITITRDESSGAPTDDVAILVGYVRVIEPTERTDPGLSLFAKTGKVDTRSYVQVSGALTGFDTMMRFDGNFSIGNRLEDTGGPGFVALGPTGTQIQGAQIWFREGGADSHTRFPEHAGDPGSPTENYTYYNLTTHKLRAYDGTTWHDLW